MTEKGFKCSCGGKSFTRLRIEKLVSGCSITHRTDKLGSRFEDDVVDEEVVGTTLSYTCRKCGKEYDDSLNELEKQKPKCSSEGCVEDGIFFVDKSVSVGKGKETVADASFAKLFCRKHAVECAGMDWEDAE